MLDVFARIARKYGRKKGVLRHLWFAWQDRMGLFQQFRTVDWRAIDRLVFVCQGNICRSAYAESLARSLGCRAASFGLRADRGDPAHDLVIRLARQTGLDLSEHRSRCRADLAATARDLLIGFEPWHGRELELLPRETGAQITLLGLWSSEWRPHLEDPYGLSEGYFRTCLDVIDSAVRNIARLCRQHESLVIENGQSCRLAP